MTATGDAATARIHDARGAGSVHAALRALPTFPSGAVRPDAARLWTLERQIQPALRAAAAQATRQLAAQLSGQLSDRCGLPAPGARVTLRRAGVGPAPLAGALLGALEAADSEHRRGPGSVLRALCLRWAALELAPLVRAGCPICGRTQLRGRAEDRPEALRAESGLCWLRSSQLRRAPTDSETLWSWHPAWSWARCSCGHAGWLASFLWPLSPAEQRHITGAP